MKVKVAPYVGAWIETAGASLLGGAVKSHPTWVRGLKLSRKAVGETNQGSHPTWVRGLKHGKEKIRVKTSLSHPTWVRGLKLTCVGIIFVGAGRTLRGCVD